MGESEVSSFIYQNLRRLITVVDELRDIGLQQYINLPRICVVGTQSSGKSSVLEAIVGIDFLPRGEGIVTRRPIEMRLVHLSENEHKLNEAWAIFEKERNKKYTDFSEVRRQIECMTDQVAGKNKGIVDEPIVLTIYGTQCPDLTLIDLPGITRVPLKGSDQCDNIEELTREMAMRYARDPRTIILAVLPANADMSTSDALQLSRRVDPKGLRTIGVITKIDLMDQGTDACKMLLGDEVPLRLGYTGIKNRSSADLKSGKTIAESLMDETLFFSNHQAYKALPPGLIGTKNLIMKLTKVLFKHIKAFLPEIKKEIGQRMRSMNNRLEELGNGVPIEVNERVQLIWTLITDYCEIVKNTIRGKYDKRLQLYFEGCSDQVSSGAQIRTIFNELLEEYVEKDVTSDMTDYDIDYAIRMHEGDSMPGFPSPDTFEYLILPHLKKVQLPVLDCLDRVSNALELVSQKVANRVFARFPRLSEQVLEQSQSILLREKDVTKVILENIVDAETGYLFTNDSKYLLDHGNVINGAENQPRQSSNLGPDGQPIFDDAKINDIPNRRNAQQILSQVQQTVGSVTTSISSNIWGQEDKDKLKKTRYSPAFLKEIRRRLDSYFSIVLRNIRDTVPKTIGYFLVRQIMDKLQFELYTELNNVEKLSDFLGEPPHIIEERKSISNQLTILRNATVVLQRDPHIAALNIDTVDDQFDSDLQAFSNSFAKINLSAQKQATQNNHQSVNVVQRQGTFSTNQPSVVQRPSGGNLHGHPTASNFPTNQTARKGPLFSSDASASQPRQLVKDPLFS